MLCTISSGPRETRAALKGPQGEEMPCRLEGSHLEEELTTHGREPCALSRWRARAASVLLPAGEASLHSTCVLSSKQGNR